MKEIPLSQTGKKYKGKYVAMVDDEDYEIVNKHCWVVLVTNNPPVKYAYTKINGKTVYLHRYIIGDSNLFVDHKDGDGLNNQKYNLQLVTQSLNIHRKKILKNNKTGIVGVFYWAKRKKFTANICCNGKRIFLGCYNKLDDAAEAYNKKALELYGPNARLNKVA